MPYAGADLDAETLFRHEADLPILVHSNAAREAMLCRWTTTGSLASGLDMTHEMWPAKYAFDDRHHLWTRPRSGAAVAYLMFEFASPGIALDVAAILGHNLRSVGGTVTCSVQIADDQAFTSNVATLASWSTSLGRRLVSTTLGSGSVIGITAAGRFTGVRYLRIRIASNGSAPVPRIGEVWLGTRAALRGRPLAPDYDEDELEGQVARWVAESGRVVMVHRYHGRRVLRGAWDGLDDEEADRFREAWDGSGAGRRSLLWIERPDSAPREAHVMRADEASFSAPEPSGEPTRMVNLSMSEEPPYVELES